MKKKIITDAISCAIRFLNPRSRFQNKALIALLAAAMMACAFPLFAAPVPTGFQEYHVNGYDQHTWDMLNQVVAGEGGGGAMNNAMFGVVAATVSSDFQILIYDQHEDGFEPDNMTDPEDAQYLVAGQASTLVFGDGDSTNGRACDFVSTMTCGAGDPADDILMRGDTLTLNSNEGTAATGCVAATPLPGYPDRYHGSQNSLHQPGRFEMEYPGIGGCRTRWETLRRLAGIE